jgi:hypothetical protein
MANSCYVPILRWKRGEWVALRHLNEDIRASITPLVELTPKSSGPRSDGSRPTVSETLCKVASDLVANWGWRPVFFDLMHLNEMMRSDDGLPALVYLSRQARSRGASIIPVTGLRRGIASREAAASTAAEGSCGACIRLNRGDLDRLTLRSDLDALLSQLGLEPSQTDLIIDLQFIGDAVPDWAPILRLVPNQEKWRTLTIAAGSFPLDLRKYSIGDHHIRRTDWIGWRNLVRTQGTYQRRPAFADYTIQHGIYHEPPDRANVSASIRYTLSEDWLILRGQALRGENTGGSAQYRSEAQWLCAKQDVFCGQEFSYGDGYIFERSIRSDPPGSPETLLRAGFNHHLTFVVRQLASFFAT